ncbi:MAG: hypothetical protein R2786_09890 [Flavobacteriaceae bacterium]
MKKTVFVLLIISLVFACQKESENFTPNAESDFNLPLEVNVPTPIYPTLGGISQQSAELNRRLSWASFIAGQVLLEGNTALHSEFLNALGTSQTLDFSTLLAENSTTPLFRANFISLLEIYVDEVTVSCHGCNPGSGQTPPIPPIGGSPTEDLVALFLDYVLNQNCLEFYFPKNLNVGTLNYISCSHPMVNKNYEWGLQHQTVNTITSSEHIVVNDNLMLNTTGNVIVARPVRVVGSINCSYSYCEVSNFTLFLDGPY